MVNLLTIQPPKQEVIILFYQQQKKKGKKNSIQKPAKIKCIAYYNERQKAQLTNSREYEVARNKQSNKDRSCQSFNKPVTCNS